MNMLEADGLRQVPHETVSQVRMSLKFRHLIKWQAVILTAALATFLGGCVETGDLGRARQSVWNQTILPSAGVVSSTLRSQPISHFAYTDDEEELRARSWQLVMPAHERSYFTRLVTEYVRTNILPKDVFEQKPTIYLNALRAEGGISPSSRYRRLTQDILAQRALLPIFCDLAARVYESDETRLRAIPFVRDLPAKEREQAQIRVAENRGLVVWVAESFQRHVAAFRHALEHLVIETPQHEAIEPERALAAYEETGACLDGLLPTKHVTPTSRVQRAGAGKGAGKGAVLNK
jgi:hypothetical protein